MAAGLGFKTFTTGEVLSAANVNGYLMQGILVFASAAARDAAITSPEEGQFAYLKDTNVTTYYTGSAWANIDTTGMTNPMTTTGDMIYSSSGSTPARLGIGTTGQVMTVAGGVPTWAAAPTSGANWSLLNAGGTALTGADTITVSGISNKDKIMVLVQSASSTNASAAIRLRVNTLATSIYTTYVGQITVGASYNVGNFLGSDEPATADIVLASMASTAAGSVDAGVTLSGCASSGVKAFNMFGAGFNSGSGESGQTLRFGQGFIDTSASLTSISVRTGGTGTFDAGTVFVYTSA